MRDVQSVAAIRGTLKYLLNSDVPSEHKSILIDALTRMLRVEESEAEAQRLSGSDHLTRMWQDHELNHLDRSLNNRVAKSWQDADETLVLIASQLQRHSADVRVKAVERGFNAAVDFAVAKIILATRAAERDH
jgi:hypothetical protein